MERFFSSFRRFVFTCAVLASFFALQIFYAASAQECFSSNLLGTASGSGAIQVVSAISNNAESSAIHSAGSRVLSLLRQVQPQYMPTSDVALGGSSISFASTQHFLDCSLGDTPTYFQSLNVVLLI